jgi:Ras GTPase-activating-like protein IQGAP2/3
LALENLVKLEAAGKVTRANDYQDMVNAIATDIRNKHRRRKQRQEELKKIRNTHIHLEEKARYLEEQKQSYLDYINACINQLSSKTKKSRPFPFTRQYFHIKDLERSGRVPRFGSYKYTAERLYQKGILLSIDQYSPKQYDRITLTISSDEPGIFTIVASMMGVKLPGGEMELRLEDLLQAQFNNITVMTLFDGACKVNVNLLLFFINKK